MLKTQSSKSNTI